MIGFGMGWLGGMGGRGEWNLPNNDNVVLCFIAVERSFRPGDLGVEGLLVPFFVDRQPEVGPCLASQGLMLFLRSLMNAVVCAI
jgi:hypothetical protein